MMFSLSYKLNAGERFVGIVRKHWFIYSPKLLEVGVIIALLAIFVNAYADQSIHHDVTLSLFISYILYILYVWILLKINYYILTDERIIKISQKGIWNRDLNEILIKDIASIILKEKGIASSVIGFGSIKITMNDSSVFYLSNIADHIKVYQGLMKLKSVKNNERIVRTEAFRQ